jgi:hypothetical protein
MGTFRNSKFQTTENGDERLEEMCTNICLDACNLTNEMD